MVKVTLSFQSFADKIISQYYGNKVACECRFMLALNLVSECLACVVSVTFNMYPSNTFNASTVFLVKLLGFFTCILFRFTYVSLFFPSPTISSTIKQNVANHNTHSHKPAGGVKKVTGVGGTTYEISV